MELQMRSSENLFSPGRSRGRTADRTRLPRRRNFRPQWMELEGRIVLAAYGASNTISNVSILSLAAQDEGRVEIDPASFDTFTLDDGVLAGNLKLSFINDFTPTLGQSFEVLTS